MTSAKVKVLQAMLADPLTDHWGYQIMKQAGVQSGSLYPILHQLESAGWVEARMEKVDPNRLVRPPRKYYRLTGIGEEAAPRAIEQFFSEFSKQPITTQLGWVT
ncbi:MAG: PadR family transcriptional regulator [Acidobacteria bacterium]|nr:PadR family transcriptional regulator [Acidobacteriota bacterium]